MRHSLLFTILAGSLLSFSANAQTRITVLPDSLCGVIRPMNAVNNGPIVARKEQQRGNFKAYRAAGIPFARTHDSNYSSYYGAPHTVDITCIFPDFSADERKEGSYDFTNTDTYLKSIIDAGAEVFFRLGQSIEHTSRKYGTWPPKDFKKWARICEHIIRHYNDGWAGGFHWNIRYWEIWNEPDLEKEDVRAVSPKTWGGTDEQFFDFYATAASYLKKCFPSLRIGGPACCGNPSWAETFLEQMSKRKVPMDFFSWHIYHNKPQKVLSAAGTFRAMMDKYGYTSAESILDEWNYIRNWDSKYVYSLARIRDIKGAAFVASTMSVLQNSSLVDMAMYYDFRPSEFCGAFDYCTFEPLEPYYAFYAWGKLAGAGHSTAVSVKDGNDVFCTAAKSAQGRLTLLVVRYNEDNNELASKRISLAVDGLNLSPSQRIFGYLTDKSHKYTQVPLEFNAKGELAFDLEPLSFILIEL